MVRGRSMSRGSGRGRKRGVSRSSSTLTSRSAKKWGRLAGRGDGPTIRGYSYPSSYNQFFDPFPRTMRAILRYSTTIWLDAQAGTVAKNIFRAGSIYDPDFSGTLGIQPYGHDTYQEIYNHYRVIKSVCKVTNTDVGNHNIMGLALHDDTSVTGNYDAIRTMKPVKFIPLCDTKDPHSLEMCYNSEAVFPGQRHSTTALFGANPAEEQYFIVWSTGDHSTRDPSPLRAVVCIDYYVEFSELKQLYVS